MIVLSRQSIGKARDSVSTVASTKPPQAPMRREGGLRHGSNAPEWLLHVLRFRCWCTPMFSIVECMHQKSPSDGGEWLQCKQA